jgi:hypothetical protein
MTQLTFDWPSAPKIPGCTPSPLESARASTFLPGVEGPVIRPPASRIFRRSLRENVERYLRERKIPYVDVNEAKRELFAASRLGAFHFVAYNTNGPNWLVWAAHVRRKVREDMAEWEKVFGEGFLSIIAKKKTGGELIFRTLKGDAVEVG